MLSSLRRLPFRVFVAGMASLLITLTCFAQQRALTADDYARAEKFMNYNTNPLVLRAGVRPTWLADGRFWYRVTTENGGEFVLVLHAADDPFIRLLPETRQKMLANPHITLLETAHGGHCAFLAQPNGYDGRCAEAPERRLRRPLGRPAAIVPSAVER